jgi:hypothetical protein
MCLGAYVVNQYILNHIETKKHRSHIEIPILEIFESEASKDSPIIF